MQQSLIDNLIKQKERLIAINPKIASFFVDIDGAPFLPIGCFRHFHIFTEQNPCVTFLSSGSTNDSRAQHSFTELGLARYQRMATNGFGFFLASLGLRPNVPVISLIPPPSEWPQSSLAAMIDMFRKEGLNVVYLEPTMTLSDAQVVIFGTSVHHLLAEPNPIFDGKEVFVIDTGGTKGRTRNFSLAEVHAKIRETYIGSSHCHIISEYGMCELSNQAWSLNEPHDGWFRTNAGLRPFIIDLDRRIVRKDDQPGFLAFVDEGNQESFMGIITEDLAVMDPSRPDCFKLVGRAPDASLKGCSLNVKTNFVETGDPLPDLAKAKSSSSREAGLGLGEAWDEFSAQDLELSLSSITAPPGLEKTRVGQRILMVLSANIPITFLYPTFMCYYRGVAEVSIQLPSTRVNDPTSERIRDRIKSLADKIAPMVAPMQVNVLESRDVSFESFTSFDAVVVFGSDETLKTFAERTPVGVELIGLGTIQNGFVIADQSPQDLAQICSRWLGRGCLTPVALIANELNIDAFAAEFDKTFSARIQAAGAIDPFVHRHRLLEIKGFFPDAQIHAGQSTFVADLRNVPGKVSCLGGGTGLVYVITLSQAQELELAFYNPEPGFLDEHQCKLWSEWL